MGFLDSILGGQKKLKGVAPDRLFAMTTAYVAMETELGMKTAGAAGIVFQPLATSDFDQILRDAEELLHGTAEEQGSTLESADDEFGYRWIVLRDPDFEDLVVSLNTISTELQGGGYGDRLLAAVFAFVDNGAKDGRVYFIYNFKRGAFYPFVPKSDKQRDTERELRLKAQLADEIPFEEDTSRWFPLWEIPL
ncbi:MAG: hypothetical protein AABM31_04335 [Actinomycetota bacterium]